MEVLQAFFDNIGMWLLIGGFIVIVYYKDKRDYDEKKEDKIKEPISKQDLDFRSSPIYSKMVLELFIKNEFESLIIGSTTIEIRDFINYRCDILNRNIKEEVICLEGSQKILKNCDSTEKDKKDAEWFLGYLIDVIDNDFGNFEEYFIEVELNEEKL